MRNLKKFLALVLAMLMVVSAAATVSAFDDVTEEHDFYVAIQDLVGKEIVQGVDENTFNPDGNVTRLQAAIMFARALTGETDPTNAYWNKGLSQFSDVTEFQYAVTVAVNAGIINGMGDGTYNPTGDIQFIQALKMAVCALGYGEGLTWGADGMEYYNVAVDLGLTAGLDYITEATKALTRGEFAQLIYNMIYADLADQSGSIAYNVFKVGYVEPVEPEPVVEMTTFIITATDEQTAAYGMDVAEGGYVGLQQLVNGIPAGDVVYVPVEVFGFEEDEDEDYFLSAYNFANYDAATGAFDYVEATGTVDEVYFNEVTAANINKLVDKSGKVTERFTVDGVNYYAVDELTGSAIRNEVVIFNSTNYSSTASQKQLFLNAAGQVLDAEGEVILEAVYSVAGDIVSYRAVRDDLDGQVTKGAYLSVSKATELYGADIGVYATPFSTMEAKELTGAYKLTVYDDDGDTKMDRAYYTPIYMSVKDNYDTTNKKHLTAGPFNGHNESTYGKVTGMEDLADGDIFVYTYNEQLKEVTVLDVLDVKEGTVKKINTTLTDKNSDYKTTITLTDGTELVMFNKNKKDANAMEVAFGAKIQTVSGLKYNDEDKSPIEYITKDQKFELINDDELLDDLTAGSLIRYYERNGYLVFAETYTLEENFERVILDEVVDADLEALYLDVYRNGKVEEIAVTKIWYDGKYVTLADQSWLKISTILGELTRELDNGDIYKISPLENGYQMSAEFIDEDNNDKADLKGFKLYEVDTKLIKTVRNTTKAYIEDGVFTAESFTDSAAATTRANRLRTNDDTIWYFIDGEEVNVFSGELEDAWIELDGTRIFADHLGYVNPTNDDNKKGTASVVYVFNAADTDGFGWVGDYSSVVFMTSMNVNDLGQSYDYYNAGDAEEVGLDPDKYPASNYYAYAATYSIDMYTGASYTVYAPYVLSNNTAYTVDSNGVVTDEKGENSNGKLAVDSIKLGDVDWDDMYVTIDGILSYDAKVDAIYARKADDTNLRKTESTITSKIMTSKTTAYDIIYVPGFYTTPAGATNPTTAAKDADGIFVVVFGEFAQDMDIIVKGAKEGETVTVKIYNAADELKETVTLNKDNEFKTSLAGYDVDSVYAVVSSSDSKAIYGDPVEVSRLNSITITRTGSSTDATNAIWGVKGNLCHKANVAIDKTNVTGSIALYWVTGNTMVESPFEGATNVEIGVAKLSADNTKWETKYAKEATVAELDFDGNTMTIESIGLKIADQLPLSLGEGVYKLIVEFDYDGTTYRIEYQFAN